MIKFFRHIRKSLIMENRTSKYFKYAIGEIILVVIGILIALQINNWNQERQNRIKETAILKQIHRDFKSNKVQLDSIISNNKVVVQSSNEIIKLMPFKDQEFIIDSIIKYSPKIFSAKTFNPSNGTVEALINSSSFDLIQNDSLRNLLVSWKDVYNDFSEEEQYARDLQISQISFFRRSIDYTNPYSDSNKAFISTSLEAQNFFIDKRGSVQEVLDAIKDEQVEYYINEIIRLTEMYN